jgi:hypothetical protein
MIPKPRTYWLARAERYARLMERNKVEGTNIFNINN